MAVATGGTTTAAAAAFGLVFRSLERGNLQRLEKGEDGEIHTGQTIEHAITTANCAIGQISVRTTTIHDHTERDPATTAQNARIRMY